MHTASPITDNGTRSEPGVDLSQARNRSEFIADHGDAQGDGFGVVVAGAGRSFRNPSRTNRPAPVLAPSIDYLAQVLSAFKAVSADAIVE